MDAYTIAVSLNEAMLLSDTLSAYAQTIPGQETDVQELLLKVGSALLQIKPGGEGIDVRFTSPELWYLREVAKTQVRFGSEATGLNLLKKVYAGLLSVSANEQVHSAVIRVGESSEADPDTGQYKDKLAEFGKSKDKDAPSP